MKKVILTVRIVKDIIALTQENIYFRIILNAEEVLCSTSLPFALKELNILQERLTYQIINK